MSERIEQMPEVVREALKGQAQAFIEEFIDDWLAADEPTRADMLAFFESDGPRKVHENLQKIEEATPTSADLEGWASLG